MSVETTAPFRRVVGTLIRGVADGLLGAARGVPLAGAQVTATASVKSAASGELIVLDPVDGTTDQNARLRNASTGEDGILLLVTDDPSIGVIGWTWHITVTAPSLNRPGQPPRVVEFDIDVPSGEGDMDLATLVPVPGNVGEDVILWRAAVEQTAANLAASEAVVATSVDAAEVVGDDLEFTRRDGSTFIAGNVRGRQGKSAYELWLDAGNTGTIEDWQEANRGQDGSNVLPTEEAIADSLNGATLARDAAASLIDRQAGGFVSIASLYDPASPPANFDAVFAAAVADGRPIYIPAGQYKGEFTVMNKSLRVFGPGVIVQRRGKWVAKVTNTPTGPWGVSALGTLTLKNKVASSYAVPYMETLRTVILGAESDAALFKAGDKMLLQSDDAYTMTYIASGSSSKKTFKSSWVDVTGIAVRVDSASPALAPGATITGATSGASGVVLSTSFDTAGNTWAVFLSLSRVFIPGEVMNAGSAQAGTANNAGTLLSAELLNDTTYSTNLRLWKFDRDVTVDMDVTIRAAEDPNTPMGVSSRRDAVIIEGVVEPVVHANILSAYKAGVVATCCYGGQITVTGGNLPNLTALTEGAYGYAAEARGATERTVWNLDVTNVRHGFTSNSYPLTAPPTAPIDVVRMTGVPKRNIVRGSARNTVGAGFDTHAGCVDMRFENCTAIGVAPAARDASPSYGFNNRGFGTTYVDCHAADVEVGFADSAFTIDAEADNLIRYQNCSAENYLRFGFFHGSDNSAGSSANGRTRYLITGFVADAAKIAYNAPYAQVGVSVSTAETVIVRPVLKGANYADILLRRDLHNLTIVDPTFYHLDSPPAAAGAGFCIAGLATAAESRRVAISGLTLFDNETGNARRSLFHVASGVTLRIRRPAAALGRFVAMRPSGAGPLLSDGPGTFNSSDANTL